MSKRMKYHPHGSVLFCTFSVEEGLLLLSNSLVQAIIRSCLARAAHLYPVKICHLLVEATHVHCLLVVDNPDDVFAFMRSFKTESAHMINNLLGRNKRTVWCEGYDSPIVLTPLRALAAVAYLYANPAKDNLVESIDDYPGFSTWKMFRSGSHTKFWKRLRRPQLRTLTPDSHCTPGYAREAERLLRDAREVQRFELQPNAWLEAFGYRCPIEQGKVNERLVARIRTIEERAAKRREKEKTRVMGKERLARQAFDLTYRPERTGKRMWCLSEKRRVRVKFIRFFRELMRKARAVLAQWRMGARTVAYPPGLYPPSMPKLADVLPR